MTLLSIKQAALRHIQRFRPKSSPPSPQLRKLGLIYCSYRFIVSGFLMVTSFVAVSQASHQALPSLLQQTALSFYLLLSIILIGLLYAVPWQLQRQLAAGLAIDVIVLSLLLYTNGAADLQLTMLYMVVVAASFMMLSATQALIITLMAIIFVIYQQFFFAIANSMSLTNLSDALLMSASFLAVGFLSWSISQRLVQVEKTAALQAQEVARLNAINQEVVSKMISGVLVINDNQVVLANHAACKLLNIHARSNDEGTDLALLQHQLTSLHPKLCDWFMSLNASTASPTALSEHDTLTADKRHSAIEADAVFLGAHENAFSFTFIYKLPKFASTRVIDKLRVEVTPLKNNSQLLILEDLRREQASAQQLKLASLGQLTASIAHEIRNPLATISQASQLLMEEVSELPVNSQDRAAPSHLMTHNRELYQMIFSQTKRVNRIIEDVLKLSRQQPPKRQSIPLACWLDQFLADHFSKEQVRLCRQASPRVYFDPHQLEQILINLINNGLRFSRRSQPQAIVEVHLYCLGNDAIIDVIDEGEGVKSSHLSRLFEPFFTTATEGTGLGLYLSQAFSEANHARLLYVPESLKTCFRLIMPLRPQP